MFSKGVRGILSPSTIYKEFGNHFRRLWGTIKKFAFSNKSRTWIAPSCGRVSVAPRFGAGVVNGLPLAVGIRTIVVLIATVPAGVGAAIPFPVVPFPVVPFPHAFARGARHGTVVGVTPDDDLENSLYKF